MFFILAKSCDEGKTWVDDFDQKYETGAEAQKDAKYYNDKYKNSPWEADQKVRYRVRRVVDTDSDNFLAREAAKNLEPVDLKRFNAERWVNYWHLPHFSPNDKHKVRFFRTIENAVEERYTVMKVSRYLISEVGIDAEECEDYLVEIGVYSDAAEFKLLRDADEIENAYVNGPTSCMNDPEEYKLPDPHPCRAYASPDLGVAVMMRGDEIVARAVVYPEKKIYLRIYGHASLLKAELLKQGYKYCESVNRWRGARLMLIPTEDSDGTCTDYVCPYLDISETVTKSRCGQYLRIAGITGAWGAQNCDGLLDNYRYR